MKKFHYINGYVLRYKPDHFRAFKSYESGHQGYVYEHILVAEKSMKRALRGDEIVHHMDLVRSNNAPENLLVISDSQHVKLHVWINGGCEILGYKGLKDGTQRLIEKHEAKTHRQYDIVKIKRCVICEFPLSRDQTGTCSLQCNGEYRSARRTEAISKQGLIRLKYKKSWCEVGRILGISDNGARKWARSYGLDPQKMPVPLKPAVYARKANIQGRERALDNASTIRVR